MVNKCNRKIFTQKDLAEYYGISVSLISFIINNKRWKYKEEGEL